MDEIHTVERDANLRDLRALLSQQIGALPPNRQEVIRLAYFENKSQREISGNHSPPLRTVKNPHRTRHQKLSHAISGQRDKVM